MTILIREAFNPRHMLMLTMKMVII